MTDTKRSLGPGEISRRELLGCALMLPLLSAFRQPAPLPEHEFLFHATAIYATGGMLLSGDDLTVMPHARMAMLKKMLPPTGVPAVFDDENLRVGTVTLRGKRMVCLFNWTDAPMTVSAHLTRASTVTDFWSGASLGRKDVVTIADMPAHSARLLECRDV